MMKVAIANEHGQVSGHFGHCSGFQIYDVKDQKIDGDVFLENPGHKPGFLPKFLSQKGVEVIIAGGMGARAQELFSSNNIDVIVGASGAVALTIQAFVSGQLKSSHSVCEEHQHKGSCGD